MRIKYKAVFLVLTCLILTSCTTSRFALTGKQYPPYSGVVRVLNEAPPDLKYEEIGWVSGGPNGVPRNTWPDLIAVMQKKAAQYGANAIIIQSMEKDKNLAITQFKELLGKAIRIPE